MVSHSVATDKMMSSADLYVSMSPCKDFTTLAHCFVRLEHAATRPTIEAGSMTADVEVLGATEF